MNRISIRFLSPGAFWLALAAAVFSTGCTQVQVAPDVQGQYKPGLGELQVFVDRDFAATHAATKQAIKDMGLFETQDDRKVVEAELRARDSRDTMVTIKLKEVAKGRTSVKIRYGLIGGDLAPAQAVFQAIKKRL